MINIEVGSRFKIKTGYGKRIMTVIEIDNQSAFEFKCTDEIGETFFFSQRDFDTYEQLNQIEILGGFDNFTMREARAQVLARLVSFAKDEKDGAKKYRAFEKAVTEIQQNDSIQFADGVLSFVSSHSGEPRRVTENGCVADACPCGNTVSYHSALWLIMNRYCEIIASRENVR